MAKVSIPKEVKEQFLKEVEVYNAKTLAKVSYKYALSMRSRFVYLDLVYPNGMTSKVARLSYNGDIDDMVFAIFKYSSERYDQEEWMFPGSECVDGTLKGALNAGIRAYG